MKLNCAEDKLNRSKHLQPLTKLLDNLDTYVQTNIQPQIDNYVETNSYPAIDNYIETTTKPNIDEHTAALQQQITQNKNDILSIQTLKADKAPEISR